MKYLCAAGKDLESALASNTWSVAISLAVYEAVDTGIGLLCTQL